MSFEFKKTSRKKSVPMGMPKSPIADLEPSGSMELDAVNELDVISSAFREKIKLEEKRKEDAKLDDCNFYLCAVFKSVEDRDEFMRQLKLKFIAENSVSGYVLAEKLGVDLQG